MESYLDTLSDRIFGSPDWKELQEKARVHPRVHFRLSGDFNDTTPFIVYKFFTALHGLYGQSIEPINIKDGCVAIDAEFSDERDALGNDFRDLIRLSRKYQQILRNYHVEWMSFQNWGGNRFANAYVVDRLGVPQPVLGAVPK